MATRRRTPAKKTTTRRRRRVSSLGKLTKASVMTATKDGVKGVIGGAAFGFVSGQLDNFVSDPIANKGAKAAVIIVTAAMLKQKEIAMGMAGAFGATLAMDLGLADSGYTSNNSGYLPPAINDGYEYDTLQDGVYPEYQNGY